MARLKVFGWSDGLKTYAVAETSRAKALAAWGVRQDLFKEGVAREIDDRALVRAALARPGVAISAPVKGGAIKAVAKAPAKPKGPSAAERRVAALRAEIEKLEQDHDTQSGAVADRRAALDTEQEKLDASFETTRSRLTDALAKARKDL